MRYGFYLFIDEAGDEGIERVRPIDADGASEYFVLCGVLIRVQRHKKLSSSVRQLKVELGLDSETVLHFANLSDDQKNIVVSRISNFKIGIIAIVSNKRNMRGYRNLRCEAKHFEIINGRKRASRHSWFYNGAFRYLLERASTECARWTLKAHGDTLPMRIVFARRKGFSYAQTKAYLYKLKVERHGADYFNNRGKIDWSMVHILGIDGLRPRTEPGLQVADCIASAIFRALDEDQFGSGRPAYLENLSRLFIRHSSTPRDYGFKLLPDHLNVPLSQDQIRGLKAVGYIFKKPIMYVQNNHASPINGKNPP